MNSLPAGEANRERPARSAGTDKMLVYTLKAVEEAVRIMHRDRTAFHVFDWGTTPTGEKWVCVLTLVPESKLHAVVPPEMLEESKPLAGTVPADASDPAQAASPEAKK